MIDPTNRNTALASALVEELARCGVRHAIASPGSRSSPMTLALDREPGIDLEMVLDERCAGFVALGAALASQRPVAVACTSGSAAANLLPAVVEADLAGVPLILLTSDRPPELRGIGAGQTIDQIKLFGDAARWFCEVGTHEADDEGLLHYRSLGCRAFGEASIGRGPVHLNLAWRDPLGPEPRAEDLKAEDPLSVSGRSEGRPLTVPISADSAPDDVGAAISEALGRAEKPLIVAGRNPSPALRSTLGDLAARSGIPVFAEPTSGLRIGAPPSSRIIAAYDLIVRELPKRLAPDLVLRFGDMPTSKPLRAMLSASGGPDQIVIDPPGRWDEPTRRAGAFIRGDGASIAAALSASGYVAPEEWGEAWTAAEAAAQGAIAETLPEDRLTEPGICRALAGAVEPGDQILLASSMPIRDAEIYLPALSTNGVSIYSNRGANGIDGTLSTAAGLAWASGSRTWVLLGDLAFAYDVGGLATLSIAGGLVRPVVVENGGGRIFEFLPQADQVERDRFERLFVTPSPLQTDRAADAYGIDHATARDPIALGNALRARQGGIVSAFIDPADNVALHHEVAAAVRSALG